MQGGWGGGGCWCSKTSTHGPLFFRLLLLTSLFIVVFQLESSVLGSLDQQNVKTAKRVLDIQMDLFKDLDELDIDCDQPESLCVTATAKAPNVKKEAAKPTYSGTARFTQKKSMIPVPTMAQAAGTARAERTSPVVGQSEPLRVSSTAHASIARKEIQEDLGTRSYKRKTLAIPVPTWTQVAGVIRTAEVSNTRKKTAIPVQLESSVLGSLGLQNVKTAKRVLDLQMDLYKDWDELDIDCDQPERAAPVVNQSEPLRVSSTAHASIARKDTQKDLGIPVPTSTQAAKVIRTAEVSNIRKKTAIPVPTLFGSAGGVRPEQELDEIPMPVSTDEELDAESETDECYCGQQPKIDRLVKENQTLKRRMMKLKQERNEANNRTIRLTDTLNSKVLGDDPHKNQFTELEGYPSRDQLVAFSDLSIKSDYPFMKLLMQELWPEGFVNRSITGRSSHNPFGRPPKTGKKTRLDLPTQRTIPLESDKVKYCEDRLMEHRLYRGDCPTVAKAVALGAKKLMRSVLSYYGTKRTTEEEDQ
ncbi:uncharacterized protein LOC110679446 isoform X2 [Aedes aegypti]|uniref:Uncharacterized protein n=1 Tax=Aedes aegypti TaxID=7159 RepID=A0A6I8U5B7_AEDAE|nr:uncharacterized protein LOC110679446 isoform X2 [Aedes aegypti]